MVWMSAVFLLMCVEHNLAVVVVVGRRRFGMATVGIVMGLVGMATGTQAHAKPQGDKGNK